MEAIVGLFATCLAAVFLSLFLMALAANWAAVLDYVINGYNLLSSYWDDDK